MCTARRNARQTIEHASQTNARGANLIPLIDPAVRPHVADYFRGKTRWARFGNAQQQYRKPIINDKCCPTPAARVGPRSSSDVVYTRPRLDYAGQSNRQMWY